MLHTSALFEPTGSPHRPLSKKENDAGWRAFVKALEGIGNSRARAAFGALTASEFNHCRPEVPAEALLPELSDAELECLDDLLRKSTRFERPTNKEEPYTSRRYRLRKSLEASTLLTAERMRRRIKDTAFEANAVSDFVPSAPVSRRSARAGL